MTPIVRRDFLKAGSVSLAALSMGDVVSAAPAAGGWKKAYMLGKTSGPILETFEMLKDAGFDGVELISPNKLDRDEVLKARDKTGIVIHGVSGGMHWSHPLSSPDPEVVKQGMAAIRQSMEDVKAYGGNTVLLVPAVVNKEVSYRQAYERSQAAIRELIPDAEKHGVKIAIEEVWNKFLLSPVEFARYIDAFKSDAIGAYFDVGNVVEYGYPQEWIRELGKRILKVHVKEYAKPRRFDYLLGEGKEIDWTAVRSAFEAVGYKGWITAEVPMKDLKDVVKRMDSIFGSSSAN